MHQPSILSLAVVSSIVLVIPAYAQDDDDVDEAPLTSIDELFEPLGATEDAADEPQSDAVPALDAPVPVETAPIGEAAAPTPAPAPSPAEVADVKPAPTRRTVAERGGLFGLGVVVAPKLGGGLGNIFFEQLGTTLAAQLELGWALPIELPLGHDLQLTSVIGYAGPTTSETIPGDQRLPGGSFDYTLTLHQLDVTWGMLYRIPVDAVPWLRPYLMAGARTVWSWTVIDGAADGEPFGRYVESGFDIGAALTPGVDFYLGPGALLVELQGTFGLANRFVLRDASMVGVQGVVGYRFFL